MTKSFEKGKGKEHLDKDFLEELKHKIWSTKGTRFTADSRLKTIAKYSTLSISFLSAYLIIFGLVSVYNLYNPNAINPNVIAFTITALSILVLVFSLLENAQNYPVKAKNFHDCALDLADLYNELQNYKSYEKDAAEKDKLEFCKKLQKEYQNILRRYENHNPIDNNFFRIKHPDYYSIKWYEQIWIPLLYFANTRLIYLTMMLVPGIILYFIIMKVA
ncbi:SLATT domain-containing protein [Aquimarina algicola]|uniref:SLATT domain-containing protein n=1 Tax=Aquimarina algicola TaxID=2589995 RepID=A0A504J305_9FLAO|nr:SLATT domain-containing protein [Aquimarina algicola]TPN82802.1 SLATT domain-containing protein [Aquimarina algicola]